VPPKKTVAAVAVDDDMEPNKVVRSGGARAASGKNAPKGKVSFVFCMQFMRNYCL
jgi:hypothetical protein